MKAQKLVLIGVAMLLLAGCGTAYKQVVLRSEILSPDGTPITVSQPRVAVRPQYVPREEEDPLVAQARAIGRQQVADWNRWRKACAALRQANSAANCRKVLGNEPDLSGSGSSYYGGQAYGGAGQGSIRATPGINWLY